MIMDDHEKQMLHDIHTAVIGNEKLGHKGLVKTVGEHNQWIQRADLKIATVIGGCGVIVFLIELLFKK